MGAKAPFAMKKTIIGNATLYLGNCLDVLKKIPDSSVDSVVTDPPYGISFMGKRWDYDVPSEDIWRECLRVLKPGGHLLAFAGTRTQHRMAVRVEDAGFEIRDMIAWVYGSGFNKVGYIKDGGGQHVRKGWGGSLKPALEPITMARKPLIGTVAENVLAHGTGGLNIDGCMVPAWGETIENHARSGTAEVLFGASKAQENHQSTGQVFGRWPANFIHDGSDEVVALFPDSKSTSGKKKPNNTNNEVYSGTWDAQPDKIGGFDDSGSAARFFYCAKASRADREEGLDNAPQKTAGVGDERPSGSFNERLGKTPTAPRANHHPTVKPTDLMRYLCRLVTPPGGIVLDPFMGSGSTGKAAALENFRFVGIEREPSYFQIACERIENAQRQNDMFVETSKIKPKQENLL